MGTANDYRKRAGECLELAQRARASERPSILRIAHAWICLVEQAEREMQLLAEDRRHAGIDSQLN
jgi:hypothetical protein